MAKKITLIILTSFLFSFLGYSQNNKTSLGAEEYETATVITYNLTFYRETSSFCNGTNNDANLKDAALAKIVDFAKPDVMVCQEIGSNFTNPNKIIENALNINGVTSWKQCDYSNNGSNLVNMLFYNSEKFDLYSQANISKDLSGNNLVRVIDFYTLYYKDPELFDGSDTVFITFIGAHLKAGNTSVDESDRAKATAAVMDYIETNNLKGNLLFMGDLNVYAGSEECFQNLIDHTDSEFNFYDPVNAIGNWNSNSSYSSYHTQSTRVASNGCLSGGGMDDRFDHILITDAVKSNTSGVEYIKNSFKVIGQDGNRYNQSIIFPQNFSVPKGIDTALYNLSDHLPVKVDLKLKKLPVGIQSKETSKNKLSILNPVGDNLTIFGLENFGNQQFNFSIIDIKGNLISQGNFVAQGGKTDLKTIDLCTGTYLLEIKSNEGEIFNFKFIKQ
jgi:endonuclease/exonuclease/phosphatase family metal-dependent hydrolase